MENKEAVEPIVAPIMPDVDYANEVYYRKLREKEMNDETAIRILCLPDDLYTGEIKKLAAKYLESRFA